MFKLMIAVCIAMASANAPPRISLDLAGVPLNAGSLPDRAYHTHPMTTLVTHDYSMDCDADNSSDASARNCIFPHARAFDHRQGEVTDVTTTVTLVDVDGVSSETDVTEECSSGCLNGADLPGKGNRRSSYLFTYFASDDEGLRSEDVNFALVWADNVNPTLNIPAGGNVEIGQVAQPLRSLIEGITATDPKDLDADYTGVGDFVTTLAARDTTDNQIDVKVDGSLAHDIGTALERCAGTQARNGNCARIPSHTLVPTDNGAVVTFDVTAYDDAGMYALEAATDYNSVSRPFSVHFVDTTPPIIRPPQNDVYECDGSMTKQAAFNHVAVGCNTWCRDDIRTHVSEDYKTNTNTQGTCTANHYNTTFSINVAGTGTQSKTYSVEHRCKDAVQNVASPVTRRIIVRDIVAPRIVEDSNQFVDATHTAPMHDHHRKYENGKYIHKITPEQGLAQYNETCCHNKRFNCASIDQCMEWSGPGTSLKEKWVCSGSDCIVDGSDTELGLGYTLTVTDECQLDTYESGLAWIGAWDAHGFDEHRVGDYTRVFTAKDHAGNEQTHNIIVKLVDTDAPIIHMNGCSHSPEGAGEFDCIDEIEGTNGEEYVDFGATCHDYVQGPLSDAVMVSGDVVNLRVPNTYRITYKCSDLAGNNARESVRRVIVYDRTPPTLSFAPENGNGIEMNFVEAGFPYSEAGVTLSDNLNVGFAYPDTSCVTVRTTFNTDRKVCHPCSTTANGCAATTGAVEMHSNGAATGVYKMTYRGSDLEGLDAQAIYRTVMVKDSLPPVITVSSQFTNPNLMAETTSVNGWFIGAVACAVSGMALLGYASTKTSTAVPV